jgi:hypothetical protein
MCFSAGASFTMAGVLTAIGGASIGASAGKSRRLFAAIPLGFAAQQSAEGIVWLTIDAPAHAMLHHAAVFAFLAFALVIWPTWVPWALRAAERDAARRKWLARLTWAGVLVSLGATVLLTRWAPRAYIEGNSVHYNFGVPTGALSHVLILIAYAAPAFLSFFVSTIDLSNVFGAALVVSMGAALAIRAEALTSVWCFFAAGLSVLIFVSVWRGPTGRDRADSRGSGADSVAAFSRR